MWRSSVRHSSILIATLLVAILCIQIPTVQAHASTTSSLRSALDLYDTAQQPVLEAHRRFESLRGSVAEAETERALASLAVDEARAIRGEGRDRFASVAIGAYMERGGRRASSFDDPQLGLALLSARLRTDERRLAAAEEGLVKTERTVRALLGAQQRTLREVDDAESDLKRAETALDALVAAELPSLSGSAFSAYRRTAATLAAQNPACGLPAAILVGLGRIMSNHGRGGDSMVSPAGQVSGLLQGLVGAPMRDTDGGRIDGSSTEDVRIGPMQLLPSQWEAHTPFDRSSLMSPEWLSASSLAAGNFLCATGANLATDEGLHRALTGLTGNASLARAVMGSARHAARSTALELGSVPADPRVRSAVERLASGDVSLPEGAGSEQVIEWSRARLGTPYSQCLGPEARPEDPECPPGTNRFGLGFFDCSGFVSAVFAAFGVSVPTTTDAMATDPTFAGHLVNDEYDPANDRAGDILLMDGHVALSLGSGSVIHASGGQLTEEPLPTWVRNGILGVYRVL